MTTYAAFITAVSGLTITDVNRSYDHTPNQLSTADLPASFPRLPEGGLNQETLSTCVGSGNLRIVELVIAIEPAGQSTVDDNFSSVVTIMDNVQTALDAANIMPLTTYIIQAGSATVSDTDYWAIVATITGQE